VVEGGGVVGGGAVCGTLSGVGGAGPGSGALAPAADGDSISPE